MHTSSTECLSSSRAQRNGIFNTTHWSLVLNAGCAGRSLTSEQALETLCRDYWPPIFSWVRRSGRTREEAEDLTQEFFASLLRYDSFARVDPQRGRFRSFLLASLKHFLSNQWHRDRAQKRGGGRPVYSLDLVPGIEWEALEALTATTPEEAFDRSWAQTVLARVVERLRHEYESASQGKRFAVLKVYLLAGEAPVPYLRSAQLLGLSESAVKSAIFKLRKRYGEMLRSEISQTLSDPSEVDDEIRHLLQALTR